MKRRFCRVWLSCRPEQFTTRDNGRPWQASSTKSHLLTLGEQTRPRQQFLQLLGDLFAAVRLYLKRNFFQ